MPKLRPIAFVLPQFHPIPENDKWWGKGFTEWTNVTKAKPLYKGHYQPQLPTDLGFYDLRLAEARQAQAEIAKNHGIYGFCYYHYWFNGKRLLHEPLDGVLNSKELDMPFMYCWAHENWTRRWDGADHDVLMQQNYTLEDDKAHIRWLCEFVFSDSRYIRVNDCPVFMIYRHSLFPDIKKTIDIWSHIAITEFGFKDLYLCAAECLGQQFNPEDYNFNACVEFSPHAVIKPKISKGRKQKLLELLGLKPNISLDFRSYKKAVKQSLGRNMPNYKLYRSVTPAFDNTARKQENGTISVGSSPTEYYKWLYNLISQFEPYSNDENFIFINAMNEWAEGNHLEPCIKYGYAYLEMTKKAIDQF